MQLSGRLLLLFIVLFSQFSCQKEEITDHKNLVVPGNTPPPYSGISSILIENYVNKMYIDLIGLKPDETAKNDALDYLKENQLSEAAREKVISDIIDLDEYDIRLFQINSDLMLNGMGYAEIQTVHNDYVGVRDQLYAAGDTFTAQYVDQEVKKLQLVLSSPDDYKNESISLNDYLGRMAFNLIYDEINMGSENFVKACFENYFKRSPTEVELKNGVDMVDGQTKTLLLKSGRNKIDFLDIVTSNAEFYQGRVLDAYRTLLLRDPESQELTTLADLYAKGDDYSLVLFEIIKTDEYAGFE